MCFNFSNIDLSSVKMQYFTALQNQRIFFYYFFKLFVLVCLPVIKFNKRCFQQIAWFGQVNDIFLMMRAGFEPTTPMFLSLLITTNVYIQGFNYLTCKKYRPRTNTRVSGVGTHTISYVSKETSYREIKIKALSFILPRS